MPPNTVYVGRPTKWGNPFLVDVVVGGAMQTRERAVMLFRRSLVGPVRPVELPFTVDDVIRELRGKDLACWCKIMSHGTYQPCHADVLLSIANDVPIEEVIRENTRRSKGEALR